MKFLKYLSLLSLLILSLFMVACTPNEHDPEEEWRNRIPDYIEEVEAYTSVSYEYDEFDLSMIKIKVYYTDGASREIPLTVDMLSAKDIIKLKSAGEWRIEVVYDACLPIKMIIKLDDSSLLDKDLNKDGQYGAVIKAIRNDKTIEFIVEPNGNACAFQFQYTFDNAIMQVKNPTQGKNSGVYSIDVKEGSICAMIVLDEAVTTETVLFTVELEGNFRTSKLAIDETFNNVCYTKIDNYQTELIEKVLYHASIK